MFTLEEGILRIELPQGLRQDQLIDRARKEIQSHIKEGKLYGVSLKINGRCTTGMALMLGHELSHICKDISIFDPKENAYIKTITH